MIEIKKYDTLVRQVATEMALADKFFPFLPTNLTPMVNDPIIAASHIFF
jgi:hypothetical protein